MAPLSQSLGGLANLTVNALLPARCLACGVTVDQPGALCAECWQQVDFIAPPYCACCGLPFEYDVGEEALCGACVAEPPAFDQARAVMRYDSVSRDLVLGFKHSDRTEGAPAFAGWLERAGNELIGEADLVTAVPLHWTRLFARRYNQAALLALWLGKSRELSAVPDLLRRRRPTVSQGHLTRAARAENVAGAFDINPARRALVQGRRVLLVDDVMTTGATVSACARTLKRAGAGWVGVLLLARVLRD